MSVHQFPRHRARPPIVSEPPARADLFAFVAGAISALVAIGFLLGITLLLHWIAR